MLDADTKRRIDNARDVLVGKVPDPKSQVEQVTIALIYKFMDDIDAQSEQLGGNRKFFAGDFTRFGWTRLIRSGLGGYEILALYSEAISRMPQNPGIPPLFRDIFKNAYLPYHDPQTLRSFLEIIDEFAYDHSERLGDAFEYLLSVLGSQGDAGQFRTPRHIIDFMVALIDPKKNETLLDPACGTAGFLISSYKHVLKNNSDDKGFNALTPDERERLAGNIKGYDISPDMVRLSLVNMYLHQLVDPHIYEYDTLTSEERWNEFADVILANPPFMSPKGGIRPHNRFSVKSKRSEVLFVDYMAEHLTPSGRAGIIVPEGIIFQSQGAYKQLRRMLLEDYLVAVVSLPAGVFQPYSGVKTSILLLDRTLARKTNHVAFFKVENDGFDLGAQRRPIALNDLPHACEEITTYLRRLRSGEPLNDFHPTLGLVVEKEKIAANVDYNLNGERYRENVSYSKIRWKMVTIGELFLTGRGRVISKKYIDENFGEYPVYSSQTTNDGIFGFINSHDFEGEYLTWTTDGANAGKVFYRKGKFNCTNVCGTLRLKEKHINDVDIKYVAPILDKITDKYVVKVGNPKLMNKEMERIQIPLPPLKMQQEIVAEIEGYQKVIDGARTVVDHYRPHIPIDPDWPMVALGEVCDIFNGSTPSRKKAEYWKNGTIPWFTVDDIRKNGRIIRKTIQLTTKKALEETSLGLLPRYTVLVCCTASVGECAFAEIELATNQQFNGLVVKNKYNEQLLPRYLFYFSMQFKDELLRLSGKTSFNFVSVRTLKTIKLPLPPLETQQAIVAEIEAEQVGVEVCRELMESFEGKIRKTIGRVWNES